MHIRWESLLFKGERKKEITMNNQNTYIHIIICIFYSLALIRKKRDYDQMIDR